MDIERVQPCMRETLLSQKQQQQNIMFYLTMIRVAIISKVINKIIMNIDEAMDKGNLIYCRWECKLVQPLWKVVWKFAKTFEIYHMH